MARFPHLVEVPFVIETFETAEGKKVAVPVEEAEVTIVRRDTKQTATVYAAEENKVKGGTVLTNKAGRIEGWLEEGPYSFKVSGGTPIISTIEFNWDAVSGRGVEHVSESVGTEEGGGVVTRKDLVKEVREALVPVGSVFAYAGSTPPEGFLLVTPTASPEELEFEEAKYPTLAARLGEKYGKAAKAGYIKLPDCRGRTLVGVDAPGGEKRIKGSQPNTLAGAGGESEHKLTSKELAEHEHKVNSTGGTASVSGSWSQTITTSGSLTGSAANHRHVAPESGYSPSFLAYKSADVGSKYFAVDKEAAHKTAQEIAGLDNELPYTGYADVGNPFVSVSGSLSGANTLSGSMTGTIVTSEAITQTVKGGGGNSHENMQPYICLNYIIRHD